MRWKGKLNAMYLRHENLVIALNKRGYSHKSPLDKRKDTGKLIQDEFVNSIGEQITILKLKKCVVNYDS